MAINFKPTKPEKEKTIKIKKEKPAKIKQDKSLKIQKEKPLKIKGEKVAKTKDASSVKIKRDKSLKIQKNGSSLADKLAGLGLASKSKGGKKPSVAIGGTKDKKKQALIIKIAIAVVAVAIVAALIAVGASKYVEYQEKVEAEGKQIASVYVSAYPSNVTYYIGDTRADYSGLKMGVMLKNGTTYDVEYSEETAKDFTFNGFDCSAYAEQQVIIVTYKGFESRFNITVKEPISETPILDKISLETLPKTEYVEGEWLSTTGGVILLEYTNHAPARINLMNKNVDSISWQTAYDSGPGTYTLIVYYVDWNTGIEKETTYEITIKAKE